MLSGEEHLAIWHGDLAHASGPLLQVQQGNIFADLVRGLQDRGSSAIQTSLNQLARHAAGVAIYASGETQ